MVYIYDPETRAPLHGRSHEPAGHDSIRVSGAFVRADKDKDGDYDPLVSTSWDGDAFSTSTGTINWNTVFGVPRGVAAVVLYAAIRDSSATPEAGILVLKAKSSTTQGAFGAATSAPSDVYNRFQGVVPVASDGTSYYSITASGVGTADIIIRVVGWYL